MRAHITYTRDSTQPIPIRLKLTREQKNGKQMSRYWICGSDVPQLDDCSEIQRMRIVVACVRQKQCEWVLSGTR